MKRRKVTAFLLTAFLLCSGIVLGGTPVQAAIQEPPGSVNQIVEGNFPSTLNLDFNDDAYTNSISSVIVNGTAFSKKSSLSSGDSKSWCIGKATGSTGSFTGLKLTKDDISFPATIVVHADGYAAITVKVTYKSFSYKASVEVEQSAVSYNINIAEDVKNGSITTDKSSAKEGDTVTIQAVPADGYELDSLTVQDANGTEVTVTDSKFTMPAGDVTVYAQFKKSSSVKPDSGEKAISIDDIKVTLESFGGWNFTFTDKAYLNKITNFSVNGTAWEKTSVGPYSGGQYRINDGVLILAESSYGSKPAIQNGDVVTIQAEGYETLVFKVKIDGRQMTLSADSELEDQQELHVRLVGSFESAILNQKGYDAISGASTNVTQNKNSDASVEVALVKKGETPSKEDWILLNKSDVRVKSGGSSVNIVNHADSSKGNDSGMEGVYSVYDSSVTLSGTPKTVGTYDISVTITDDQGRTASSNALTFRVYSGQETLKDQLILDNCTKTADGKYMYDMEPWAIQKFDMDGKEQTVTVPTDLKAWYGSHTSGTYGELGYAVPEGTIQPQTLILPEGCNLTLVNMDILSSVRIVVQNGAKLTLRDSVIQGSVEVESGGTFSMNYNDYGEGEFLNGASINGKLILKDGSTLENAKIYSNTNNVANGSEARHNTDPVVVVNGNVTLRGKVFIRGDEAPTGTDPATGESYSGQSGMQVNGTLTLEKDSVLAVYGAGKDATTTNGGDAIILNGGTITGEGKLIAVGGDGHFGKGGDAVSGEGTISVKDAYLEGGASVSKDKAPGQAISNAAKLSGNTNRNLVNGKNVGDIDYDNDTYWRDILTTPDLSLYPVGANAPGEDKVNPDDKKPDAVDPSKPNSEKDSTVHKETTKSKEGKGKKKTAASSEGVATGDTSDIKTWVVRGLGALVVVGLIDLYRRRKRVQ